MSRTLVVSIISLLMYKALDTTDPEIQFNIKVAFVAVHVAIVLSGLWMYIRICRISDNTIIKVPEDEPPFGVDKTEKKDKFYDSTVASYDKWQLFDLFFKKMLFPMTVILFIAYKWQLLFPLMVQIIHNPMQVIPHQLFQVHILGEEAKHELARPWPPQKPMPEWMYKMFNMPIDDAKKKK